MSILDDRKNQEYLFEWRKVVSKSLLIPPIRTNSSAVLLNNDLYLFYGKGLVINYRCYCF